MKHCYDDASLFTTKMIDLVDANTPTNLKIEVCRNSAVAFVNRKASTLAEYGLAMAKDYFGEDSMMYAEGDTSLV